MMESTQGVNIVAKHLNEELVNAHIVDLPKGAICAFTGQSITKGQKLSKVISGNFTDWNCVKHNSEYIGKDVIVCLKETNKKLDKEGYESIRLRNFIADNSKLKILSRDEILPAFFAKKQSPFVMCIGNVASTKCMKNLTYKSVVNYNQNNFTLTTEQGLIHIDLKFAKKLHAVIQNWYSYIDDGQKSTYFNKTEIRTGNCSYSRIEKYGIEKYLEENKFLQKNRKKLLFTFLLNFTYAKKQNKNNGSGQATLWK